MPLARFHVALLMDDRAAAEAAIPIIAERLATGISSRFPDRTFADFFPNPMIAVAPDVPVVLLDLPYGEETPAGIWWVMFASGDLVFLVW